jgi:hypothetical protein
VTETERHHTNPDSAVIFLTKDLGNLENVAIFTVSYLAGTLLVLSSRIQVEGTTDSKT